MNIVMPIAGLGSRFTKVGIDTPKPLIDILDKPMVQWAVDSLPFARPEQFIFIVRQEHVDSHKIDEYLQQRFPGCRVVVIDHVTEGAACTVLLAKEHIDNDEPLIITDCDHYFENKEYNEMAKNIPEGIRGMIPVFKAEGEKWSFARFGEDGIIKEVAEKRRISSYANVGAYFFTKGSDFVWAAEQMIKENKRVNNEFYIAPVYNELISKGLLLRAPICERVWGLGTPEDVERFKQEYPSSTDRHVDNL